MVFLAIAIAVLVAVGVMVYRLLPSRRLDEWERHTDAHAEAITEHRVRRNFGQGGG